MATIASNRNPATPTKKWKRFSMGKKKIQDPPKEADNGVGRSLSASRSQRKKGGIMRKLRKSGSKKGEELEGTSFNHTESSPSNPQSPSERSLRSVESEIGNKGGEVWQEEDTAEERQQRDFISQKQHMKERD
ncbi:MAG: hypothetical protein SGBAC_006087, partial [Bacillariaceae sp.]